MKRGLGRAVHECMERDGVTSGTVRADLDGTAAEVDVVESDRLGVRVARVKVTRAEPFDIADEARGLGDRLRALPERVGPVEIAPELGGAVLRTVPEDVVDGEFYEVELQGTRAVEVDRHRAHPNGGREAIDWTMTKGQLERLIDELS